MRKYEHNPALAETVAAALRASIDHNGPLAAALAPHRPQPGIVQSLTAAAAAAGNLDERGIPLKLGRMFRQVERAGYDKATRTVTMAVSSSTPVERGFGVEILSHAKGAVRTGRLGGGVSLLFNHDYDQLLGRTRSFALGDPIRVTAGFGTSQFAREKEDEVEADVLVDVSIGYLVYEWEITEDKNGVRTYLAVDWEILEVSLVTVPADPSVGVGRDLKDGVPVVVRSFRKADPEESEAAARSEEDDDEDDEDDDDEADKDAERSLPAAAPVPASAPEPPPTLDPPPTPQPTETRSTPMAVDVIDNTAADNATRLEGLRSLHKQYPTEFNERSLKAAEDLGVSVDTAKARTADFLIAAAQRNDVPTVGEEVLGGMTDKDLSRYSLAGAHRAAANAVRPGTFRGKGNDGGYEQEVGEDFRKKAGERGIEGLGGGIPVPSISALSNARGQRAITSGGNAGASTNFTTVVIPPIELLRNKCVLLAAGMRMLPGLQGAVQMTKQTGAATSNWELELGTVTNSDPTLGFFTMKPNRLSIANSYTRDFLAQSALSIESFLSDDRMEVLARALDTAGLAGTGVAPVPLGLLNQTGLAAILAGSTRASNGTVTAGAGGVPMTFVDFNNMEAAIATANADIGDMTIITTPRVRAAARSTPKTPGTATDYVWPSDQTTGPLGKRALVTSNPVLTGFTANAVNNLHAVIMGVFPQLLCGDWGLSELIADNITGAAQAIVKFTEHAFYDINNRHIEAFAACTSALPS